MAVQQIGEQAQQRVADLTGGASILFAGMSLFQILQTISLILAIACGAFSLYFHIRRFIRERRGRDGSGQ